jgi:MFS family permease
VALSIGALAGFGLAGSVVSVLATYLLLQVAAAVAQAGQQGYIPDLVQPNARGLAAGFKGLMDVGGATVGFVLLGGLLSEGSITPALFAVGGSLLATYLLALLLVREPRLERASAPRPGLTGAFRLDWRRHGAFVRVVASRFLFLLGTFAVGRFLLLFVADRLQLDPSRAAEEAGMLLAALTLVTALAAPLGGWAADRLGRVTLMLAGAALSAVGVLGLIGANSPQSILLFGAVMSLGTAAFASANWAMTTELIPPGEAARFMGLANFGTAGGAAAAGLLGPLVDWGNAMADGRGFTFLFVAAALAFGVSTIPLYRLQERMVVLSFNREGAEHERA